MDIYKEVSDRIIAQMEQGQIPWQKPWISAGNAVSRATGKPYSLLNQISWGVRANTSPSSNVSRKAVKFAKAKSPKW